MNKEFVRVKLGIAPDGEAWNLQLSADYSEWKNNGPIAALIAVRPGSVATNLPIAAPVRPGDTLNNYITDEFYASFAGNATPADNKAWGASRSEEHTSELQSLMRISYAGFCLTKKQ